MAASVGQKRMLRTFEPVNTVNLMGGPPGYPAVTVDEVRFQNRVGLPAARAGLSQESAADTSTNPAATLTTHMFDLSTFPALYALITAARIN